MFMVILADCIYSFYPNKSNWIMPILVCKICGISFKTCVVTSKNVAIILKQRKPQQWLVSGPREQYSEGNRHQKLLHFSSSFDCLNICIIVYFCTCWFQLCQVRIHVSYKWTFLTLLTFTQIVVWISKGFKFLLFIIVLNGIDALPCKIIHVFTVALFRCCWHKIF